MTVINTNVKSLISQNALMKNNRSLSAAMEQLSTGKRINSAKDDAAGLAISSRMTAQIRGLDQSVRNGNDAVSMLQTAEGALIEVTNMLQRMRELSVQAANDTYAPADRGYLDLEFQQLKDEVHRVSRATQWNGMNILDGSFVGDEGVAGKFAFQVGANQSQVITHTLGDIGFRDSRLTIAPQTQGDQQSVPAIAEVTKLTVNGSYKTDDELKVTLNGTTVSYTVLAGDTAADIASGLKQAIEADASLADFTLSLDNNVLSVMGKDDGSNFSLGASSTLKSTDVGELSNIRELNILNTPQSSGAIKQLDMAINHVNSSRADIGAMINRLTYAVDNLTNVSQYTSASRSTIQDADYAKASSELARTQIIQQAATAVLAQANQQPQSVLKLLQA
jgi:flagellin